MNEWKKEGISNDLVLDKRGQLTVLYKEASAQTQQILCLKTKCQHFALGKVFMVERVISKFPDNEQGKVPTTQQYEIHQVITGTIHVN